MRETAFLELLNWAAARSNDPGTIGHLCSQQVRYPALKRSIGCRERSGLLQRYHGLTGGVRVALKAR